MRRRSGGLRARARAHARARRSVPKDSDRDHLRRREVILDSDSLEPVLRTRSGGLDAGSGEKEPAELLELG